MELTNKFLYQVFSIFIFCIGLSLLIYSVSRYRETLNLARKNISEQVIYQQYSFEDFQIVSRSQIIASLLYPQDYDVQIEDLYISREDLNYEKVRSFEINETYYKKDYQYDSNGNILCIIYNALE